jgi:2-methylisocitrate lyase-like PEP mutase family enzyme
MALPMKFEQLRQDVFSNPNNNWRIMLDSELLNLPNCFDAPIKAGQKLFLFNNINNINVHDNRYADEWTGKISPCKAFRQLLSNESIVIAPGAYNALTARLAENQGFKCIHVGGNGISCSLLGMPDMGFLSLSQILDVIRGITGAVRIPVIADADTGYGNEKNVWYTVKEFERAGVAGIHIEDQVYPKRCGYMAGKQVISIQDMVKKIRAAKQAATDPDFYVIARTDAIEPMGFKEAVTRGRCYLEAGADMIFVSAPENEAQLRQLPELIPGPLMINMAETGTNKLYTAQELQQMGYKMVTYSVSALLATAFSVNSIFMELSTHGTTKHLQEKLYGFKDLQELLMQSKEMPQEV